MLKQITLSNLRNISDASLEPVNGINLIVGENGSGKTSLLEGIHLLALGRSFRTRTLKNIVQLGKRQFQVTAKTNADMPVGLRFDLNAGLQIRLNSAPIKKLSELAVQLPLQLIPANCHQFFEQGPRYRRQLLDWGLFHVEQSFNYQWQSYRKVLQQRNSAIRQHKPREEIQLWDPHLANYGEKITAFRQKQLVNLLQQFEQIFPRLCPEFEDAKFSIKYRAGWAKEHKLEKALQISIERDQQLGYTRSGSHAADWFFQINNSDPADVFSRGQQKLFFLALCMSQAEVTQQANSASSILLLDDISSELDRNHQDVVLKELGLLPVQSFITTTELTFVAKNSDAQVNMFHVKQGVVSSNE